jgi:DNA-binding MarR family transcriptional regulator
MLQTYGGYAVPVSARWLSPREERAWLAYVDLSTLLGDYLDQQLRRDAGLSHLEYALMAYLSAAPDQVVTMTRLAEWLKITRSRLTRMVIRLEEAGYVLRRPDPDDRRGQLTVLTDGGMELLAKAAPGHVAAVRHAVFDALTSEQVDQLADIGEAITQALRRADYPADLPWSRR